MKQWQYTLHLGGVVLSTTLIVIKSSCPLLPSEMKRKAEEKVGGLCEIISYDVRQIRLPSEPEIKTYTSLYSNVEASGTTTTTTPSPSPEIPPDGLL